MTPLLIAGGAADGNLTWLQAAAQRIGVACEMMLVDGGKLPAFSWDVSAGKALLNGSAIAARAAFIRYDVFPQLNGGSAGAAASAMAWYAAVSAYCEAEGLFTLNRNLLSVSGSKPAMLRLAARSGLATPRTIVTNSQPDALAFAAGPGIAKPVGGGSYVVSLDQAVEGTAWEDSLAPSPAIVQPMLSYPERRIYRVGEQFFAFDIASTTLDSRLDGNMKITPVETSALGSGVIDGIARLTGDLRCDFCAIDMKTDPRTGELVFLELNSGPMFKAYDRAGGGAMSEAMVRYLLAGTTGPV